MEDVSSRLSVPKSPEKGSRRLYTNDPQSTPGPGQGPRPRNNTVKASKKIGRSETQVAQSDRMRPSHQRPSLPTQKDDGPNHQTPYEPC